MTHDHVYFSLSLLLSANLHAALAHFFFGNVNMKKRHELQLAITDFSSRPEILDDFENEIFRKS